MARAKASGVAPIQLDRDAVRDLAPDLILAQSVCKVCAVGEGELAGALAALDRKPRVVTLHAHTLDGVFADIRRVGEALDLADEAEELVAGMRYRLRIVSSHTPTSPHPRVLVLEWLDPPYVAGHWVPELVTAAGGEDVGAGPGEPSRPRTWRELAALATDVVVVAPCGFDVPRAQHEYAAVIDRDARVLFHRRVEFLDGNAYTSRPGPRLADAAELLSQLIHG